MNEWQKFLAGGLNFAILTIPLIETFKNEQANQENKTLPRIIHQPHTDPPQHNHRPAIQQFSYAGTVTSSPSSLYTVIWIGPGSPPTSWKNSKEC